MAMADRRSKRLRGRSCDHCLEGHLKKKNKPYQLKEIRDAKKSRRTHL